MIVFRIRLFRWFRIRHVFFLFFYINFTFVFTSWKCHVFLHVMTRRDISFLGDFLRKHFFWQFVKFYQFFRLVLIQIHFGSGASRIRNEIHFGSGASRIRNDFFPDPQHCTAYKAKNLRLSVWYSTVCRAFYSWFEFIVSDMKLDTCRIHTGSCVHDSGHWIKIRRLLPRH